MFYVLNVTTYDRWHPRWVFVLVHWRGLLNRLDVGSVAVEVILESVRLAYVNAANT